MVRNWSFCCLAVRKDPRNNNPLTSPKHKNTGLTIKEEKERGLPDAAFKRI
jgi:hypothetical protein